MKKLICTVDISGSGKTTWRNKQVSKYGKSVLVLCRDELREIITGHTSETIKEYYKSDTSNIEYAISRIIEEGILNVSSSIDIIIIDATNLRKSYLDRFKVLSAKKNFELEIKKFDCTVEQSLENQKNRKRKVGREILEKQYKQFKELEI